MPLEELSLFFPCHNEEANVEAVIREALRAAPQAAKRFEIIIVDDGSSDQTAAIAARFEASGVRVVRHAKCLGYGAALRSGLGAARYEWIFFSDGDGQFDLAELPRLTELAPRADIVSGVREHRADPWPRLVNARLFDLALRLLFGLKVRDVNGAFKLFHRRIFDGMALTSSGAMINAEIFLKAQKKGCTLAFLPVSHRPRKAGLQTGAQPKVIWRAMQEFCSLWHQMRKPSHAP